MRAVQRVETRGGARGPVHLLVELVHHRPTQSLAIPRVFDRLTGGIPFERDAAS